MSLSGRSLPWLQLAMAFGLALLLPDHLHAQAKSLDSTIKVGGGSTTFYTKQRWYPAGQSSQYCTTPVNFDVIALTGFGRELQVISPAHPWQITMTTSNGATVTLQENPNGSCNGQKGPTLVATLSSGLRVYKYMLDKKNIREHFRIRDTNCKKTEDDPAGSGKTIADPDACERLDSITINSQQYQCDDLDCNVYLGDNSLLQPVGSRRSARRRK